MTKPPLTGRGGGLAVVFKNNYKMTKYDVLNVSSFECLSFKLAGPAPLLILLIYRPPKHNSSFLSELTELLTLACAQHDRIIMLGDINIHVDSDCNTANDFLSVLDYFDASQHIDFPTHSHSHTLDLLCTVGIDNVGAQGHEMGISDHKLIVFGFPLPLVKPKTKTTISYRNLKSVTTDSFSVAIAASPLSSALNLLSPDEILSTYNETTCNVLDDLAPLKTRTVPSAHSSPWFTPELRVMKAECRRYERLHKKSSLVVHAIAFSDSVVKYKEALNTARSTYLSTAINKAKCKRKALFSEINKLVKPSSAAINGSVDLCESFQSFFLRKIDNIYQEFSPSVSPHLSLCLIGHPLNTFLPTNISAVEQLVIKSNSASCTLDPIPTYLLKTLLASLIQPITHIINRSPATGYVPQEKVINRLQMVQNSAARVLTFNKKSAHITPILHQLHWLPVPKRIQFKHLVLVYKAHNGHAPQYLVELVQPYVPARTLRSSNDNLLVVPKYKLSTVGGRAFCIIGPKLWNKLPHNVCAASSLQTFKSQLKTHLFTLFSK